jgi:hypothetical protein
MFRLVLVVALVAGVARLGDAAPGKTKQTSSKSSKQTSKKSKSKKSKEARVSRVPTRASLANMAQMPHGFTWPPTPAMEAAEKECEAKLDRAGITWERTTRDGRIVNAIIVPSMTFGGVKYSQMWGGGGPHKLDCQFALALETIGPELYALGVREVKFGSLYRWSNVRAFGKTKPILSRHGLGIAMDIGSFVDENGRNPIVKQDYKKGDLLLLGVEQAINASGNFRTVLTPKNDPVSHSDHFHIEAKTDYAAPDVM